MNEHPHPVEAEFDISRVHINKIKSVLMECLLSGGFTQGQVNSAVDCTTVQPTVSIHSNCLPSESFEIAWFMDRFQEWKQAYCLST